MDSGLRVWPEFVAHPGRRMLKSAHYFPAYERHFAKYVNRPALMIEIGVAQGGSLQMWKRVFGPYMSIVGIDINPACKAFEEDRVAVRIGDQKDTALLQSIIDEFGSPDIVIDDGSHNVNDMRETFKFLYPRCKDDAVYMVEDTNSCYHAVAGGGLKHPDSFIEYSKNLIDELNAPFSDGAVQATDFTHSTISMHFYDSLIVFEKGKNIYKKLIIVEDGEIVNP